MTFENADEPNKRVWEQFEKQLDAERNKRRYGRDSGSFGRWGDVSDDLVQRHESWLQQRRQLRKIPTRFRSASFDDCGPDSGLSLLRKRVRPVEVIERAFSFWDEHAL